jgi:hypothetical protein
LRHTGPVSIWPPPSNHVIIINIYHF